MVKKQGLAGMNEVAGTNKDNKTDTDSKVDTSETKETNDSVVTPSIDDIISEVVNKPKKQSKKQIAIYLDDDVARAFDKYGKKVGKGAKSELIEKLLKSALTKMDYM